MKNNTKKQGSTTELVFILDRSGSMSGLESDTIGGFQSMIQKQKKTEGKAYVTTVLFNGEVQMLHDRLELEKVPPMTEKDYTVYGCTALLDAVGDTIRHIVNIHRYARPEDVPANTVFVITTDGMENASRRYSADQVRAMIEKEKTKYGWEFLFLGANMDAVAAAGRIGIGANRSVTYCCDAEGTRLNYETVSDTICGVRNSAGIQEDWALPIQAHRAKKEKNNRG